MSYDNKILNTFIIKNILGIPKRKKHLKQKHYYTVTEDVVAWWYINCRGLLKAKHFNPAQEPKHLLRCFEYLQTQGCTVTTYQPSLNDYRVTISKGDKAVTGSDRTFTRAGCIAVVKSLSLEYRRKETFHDSN